VRGRNQTNKKSIAKEKGVVTRRRNIPGGGEERGRLFQNENSRSPSRGQWEIRAVAISSGAGKNMRECAHGGQGEKRNLAVDTRGEERERDGGSTWEGDARVPVRFEGEVRHRGWDHSAGWRGGGEKNGRETSKGTHRKRALMIPMKEPKVQTF